MYKPADYTTIIFERNWLADKTFELVCGRPPALVFTAGQKIRIESPDGPREYSIASAPGEKTLRLCIRKIEGGRVSARLGSLPIGSELTFSGPFGYFTYRPTGRQAVFVATGTGIAPFAAMNRSGVRDYILLHGVRRSSELYYRGELESIARRYIPCISEITEPRQNLYAGRVTDFLESDLPPAAYDFYLCGSGAMINDVILLIDDRFDASRAFTEKFY